MTAITGIIAELRQSRLWPIAAVLVVALVAVPVVLSKSPPTKGSRATGTSTAGSATLGTTQPVSVQTSPPNSELNGPSRDPFAQQNGGAAANGTSGTTAGPTVTGTSGASGSTGSAGSTGLTAGTSAPGSSTGFTSMPAGGGQTTSEPEGKPATNLPRTPHAPAPSGLTAVESYRVALAITNSAGGFDTLDPLERLSVLPTQQQALLVELGVLAGGHRVLFALQPGAVVKGPGRCTPGPVDCEVLSLGENQIEQLSRRTGIGSAAVASFAVTAITAEHHASAGNAMKTRHVESEAGRDLLRKSRLAALSLFRYEPGLGAIVDLRNLAIEGG